ARFSVYAHQHTHTTTESTDERYLRLLQLLLTVYARRFQVKKDGEESIGSLSFCFPSQTWIRAWEVSFRGYLQPSVLTLFLYRCFRRTLCVCGMRRKLFLYANTFFPLPLSAHHI